MTDWGVPAMVAGVSLLEVALVAPDGAAAAAVLSVLSWLVFGALLLGRLRHGWRGRRAVRLTLGAMLLLLLAFFGSKFVLELLLDRAP